jgi:hypothetical protein
VKTLRRSALLLAIAIATVTGLTTGTAQAAFADTTTPTTLTIGTTTVTPPATVTARLTSCSASRTQYVQVTWTASTSARVSGYTVTVLTSAGGTLATGQVGPTATSVTITVDRLAYDASTLTFSVTTLTDYGWTATSARKAALPC